MAAMSKQHQIGGRRAQGFAALSREERKEMASRGGSTVAKRHGRAHMAKIGSKGGTQRAINAVTKGKQR